MKRKNRFRDKYFDCQVDVNLNLDEIFDEITDEELLDEVEHRNLNPTNINKIEIYNKENFKRKLCDILELGYCVSNNDIIQKIRENLT